MFHRKIDDILREFPDVFRIADVVPAVGYNNNSSDHEYALCRMLHIY